jgi:hypothetical protein
MIGSRHIGHGSGPSGFLHPFRCYKWMARCEQCGSAVALGEAAWRQLHPQRHTSASGLRGGPKPTFILSFRALFGSRPCEGAASESAEGGRLEPPAQLLEHYPPDLKVLNVRGLLVEAFEEATLPLEAGVARGEAIRIVDRF